jgi:hypothetical protein
VSSKLADANHRNELNGPMRVDLHGTCVWHAQSRFLRHSPVSLARDTQMGPGPQGCIMRPPDRFRERPAHRGHPSGMARFFRRPVREIEPARKAAIHFVSALTATPEVPLIESYVVLILGFKVGLSYPASSRSP